MRSDADSGVRPVIHQYFAARKFAGHGLAFRHINDHDSAPVPRIDHVMVLLHEQAYLDVAANTFLRDEFARMHRKDADSSVAGKYATLGIAGENTLIELFGSAPLAGGLVFSFEEPGSSPFQHIEHAP